MRLFGQYDSPFVRRVGITLRLYDLPFEHVPWSVWGDFDRLGSINPLRRVPTLELDDGTVLVETFVIVDTLDELVGEARALLPRSGPRRREGLRLAALAAGAADKAVSLLYEGLVRDVRSSQWVERCERQVLDTIDVAESALAAAGSPYFLGDAPSHPDVTWTCTLRFAREAHPQLVASRAIPRLDALAASLEATPPFEAIRLPITNVMTRS